MLILQIESKQAYDNLEEIAAVPGIDVLLVGPMDMSASLGMITDMQNKAVQEIMQDIPKRLQGTGIVTGTTLESVTELQQKIDWGYRFLNIGSILGYGVKALNGHVDTLRKHHGQ